MKRGNIIRFEIDRAKYHLPPSNAHYSRILIGTILKIHPNKISVKAMDIWSTCEIKYLTIKKEDVIMVL